RVVPARALVFVFVFVRAAARVEQLIRARIARRARRHDLDGLVPIGLGLRRIRLLHRRALVGQLLGLRLELLQQAAVAGAGPLRRLHRRERLLVPALRERLLRQRNLQLADALLEVAGVLPVADAP